MAQCTGPDCQRQDAVARPSMTCYVDSEGKPTEELNPRPVLCEEHFEEYVEYWQEMWDEYRSSQGV